MNNQNRHTQGAGVLYLKDQVGRLGRLGLLGLQMVGLLTLLATSNAFADTCSPQTWNGSFCESASTFNCECPEGYSGSAFCTSDTDGNGCAAPTCNTSGCSQAGFQGTISINPGSGSF